MKTKTYYVVSMAYCCGRLGMSKTFDKYSDAKEFALKAKEDVDNTYITNKEILQPSDNFGCITEKNVLYFNQ